MRWSIDGLQLEYQRDIEFIHNQVLVYHSTQGEDCLRRRRGCTVCPGLDTLNQNSIVGRTNVLHAYDANAPLALTRAIKRQTWHCLAKRFLNDRAPIRITYLNQKAPKCQSRPWLCSTQVRHLFISLYRLVQITPPKFSPPRIPLAISSRRVNIWYHSGPHD